MKIIKIVLVSVVFMAVILFSEPEIKIGYIDFQKVVLNYNKAQEREKAFKQEIQQQQSRINQMKEDLISEQNEYSKKLDLMKPEEKKQKEEQLKTKYKELSELSNKINKELQQKQAEFEEIILKEIRKATAEYATKNKYTIIFNGNAIFYPWEGIDVTDEVIKILNKSK